MQYGTLEELDNRHCTSTRSLIGWFCVKLGVLRTRFWREEEGEVSEHTGLFVQIGKV